MIVCVCVRLSPFKNLFSSSSKSNPDEFVRALDDLFTKLDVQQEQRKHAQNTPWSQVVGISIMEVRTILANAFKGNTGLLQLQQMNDVAEVFGVILSKLESSGMRSVVDSCFSMNIHEDREVQYTTTGTVDPELPTDMKYSARTLNIYPREAIELRKEQSVAQCDPATNEYVPFDSLVTSKAIIAKSDILLLVYATFLCRFVGPNRPTCLVPTFL
jgi:hypothetical protein